MLYFIYSAYVSKYIFFIYDYLLILNSMRLDKDGGRWDEAEDEEGEGEEYHPYDGGGGVVGL
jgi:hypothetical protein